MCGQGDVLTLLGRAILGQQCPGLICSHPSDRATASWRLLQEVSSTQLREVSGQCLPASLHVTDTHLLVVT